MKKITSAICACLLLFTGCASNKTNSSSSSEVTTKKHSGDAYTAYTDSLSSITDSKSWSAAVNSTYKMGFSDDTIDAYVLDGVLEVQDTDSDPTAHITQNIDSNGGVFSTEGYYYGGRLYNTYNDVNYYEDLSLTELEKTMLVPMSPETYTEDQIEEIKAEDGSDGSVIYTIKLTDTAAASIFSDRYDSYGLSSYDDYAVTDSTIVDTFDSKGHFVKETASFTAGVSYSGEKVSIDFSSSVNYLKFDETEVKLTDAQKSAQKEYVAYQDIDTDAISSDSDSYDDTAEATVTDTFKKRLVNRLGYSIIDTGQYQSSYNDTEVYTIDFSNCIFEYSNYSIHYTYSWKNEAGSMGDCTLNFKDDTTSSSCVDSTVEMIRKVKTYLEMELYYCGLSLDDLEAEAKGA